MVVTINGIDITVDVANGTLTFIEAGLTKELKLMSFTVNMTDKTIPVIYSKTAIDANGGVVNSVPHIYNAVIQNETGWTYFYDSIIGENKLGDALMQMCINGISLNYFGEKIFVE